MKVLLCGITGNVGSRLAPALIAHGHSVVAYIRTSSRNKINPALASQLAEVVEGEGTDAEAIKNAVLDHGCNAVVNSAGHAAITSWHKPSQLPAIVAAVIKGITEARQARGEGSPPIRVWFLSGQNVLDYPPNPKKLIGDFFPFVYPEHRANWDLIKTFDAKDLPWSLLCATQMSPKYEPALTTHPHDTCGNMISGADTLVALRTSWLSNIPLVGDFLNVFSQSTDYYASYEDCVDIIATDLDKGLNSEYIGKRVTMKLKPKVIED